MRSLADDFPRGHPMLAARPGRLCRSSSILRTTRRFCAAGSRHEWQSLSSGLRIKHVRLSARGGVIWGATEGRCPLTPRRCRMGTRATSPWAITRRYASPTPRASRTTPSSSPTESPASRWAHPRRSCPPQRCRTAHAAAALLLPHELPVACFAQICQALDEGVRGMRVGDRRCAPAAVKHHLPPPVS